MFTVGKSQTGVSTPALDPGESNYLKQIDTIIYNEDWDNRPFAKISINDQKYTGLLDSGANKSAMGLNIYQKLKKFNLQEIPTGSQVKTATGITTRVQSCLYVPIRFKDVVKVLPILVIPELSRDLILGMDFWKIFDLQIVDSIDCLDSIQSYSEEFHKLSVTEHEQLDKARSTFLCTTKGKLGRTSVLTHTIDTGNSKPFRQRPYQVSPYVQKKIDVELDRMLELGVIVPSCSPWSSPIVAVDKKNGKTRICLDSRKLNEYTVKEAYPLPYITRILGRLKSTNFLSSIDLSDAFWQVPLDKESQLKTAFRIPGRGLFMYTCMAMGLCNSAQIMSKLMDMVLGCDLEPAVFCYLDDIVICTENFEEHLLMIKEVSKRLRLANLTINVDKSKFCVKRLKYLGYVLEPAGLRIDPDKIEAIIKYPAPKTVKEVRRFMGMAGWYHRFIKDYAKLATPLTDLTKKTVGKFVWTERAENAFSSLKTALMSAPVLVNPRYDLPFTVQCDASDTSVAGVLTQNFDGGEHVIAYVGQKLNPSQRKYFACEKELLALLVCIEKFRGYIEGVKFHVITDNSAVTWLQKFKDPSGRLARWALKLQKYNFDVTHRAGKLNKVADALSRVPDDEICEIFAITNNDNRIYEKLLNDVQQDPANHPKFTLKQQNLWFKVHNIVTEQEELKLVVPPNDRIRIMTENHDPPLAAHLGFYKTKKKIQERYFWPKMSKDIKTYVSNCDKCKAIKYPNTNLVSPMGKSKEYSEPWQMISIDFTGPFPRSRRGNTTLLVVTDWLTKFTLIKPMRNMLTGPTVKFLEEEVFLVYGVPEVLLSDNAAQFKSKKFNTLLKNYHIKSFKNARYFPQNNCTERVNRTIGAAIRAYMENDHREWDLHIPEIACAMRTATHEGTKRTPYSIMFGRDMVVNTEFYTTPAVKRDFLDDSEHQKRVQRMENTNRLVKENLLQAHAKSATRYNLRTRPIQFDVGDTVWRRNFVQSKAANAVMAKLLDPFIKCKIKRRNGANTYTLEDMNGKEVGVFHTKDIKKD